MKHYLLTLIALLCVPMLYAQEQQQCNLQGIIKYEYNDYEGYKTDIGAEVGIVPVSKANMLEFSKWEIYEDLAKRRTTYVLWKNDEDLRLYGDENLRRMTKFSHTDEEKLNSILQDIMTQYIESSKLFEYIGLVDSSGKYAITLPYGEYYIFAKSANRTRLLLPEINGRLMLKKVKIDRPAQIVSFEFCY